MRVSISLRGRGQPGSSWAGVIAVLARRLSMPHRRNGVERGPAGSWKSVMPSQPTERCFWGRGPEARQPEKKYIYLADCTASACFCHRS